MTKLEKFETLKQISTFKELNEYITSVQDKIIGNPINKIMVFGTVYTDDRDYYTFKDGSWYSHQWKSGNSIKYVKEEQGPSFDGSAVENVDLLLDEPAILFIGDNRFEIDYPDVSNAKIATDTVMLDKYSDRPDYLKDVSKYYSKNIIGHNVTEIEINKTDSIPIFSKVEYGKDDTRYNEIYFVLDNGYKLEISFWTDYMLLSEVKNEI